MYQRFIAVGRLGRDPQIATTTSGLKVATLSLATSEFFKGEARTEWHRVVIWDEKLIEVVERHATKGTMVAIEGQVRTRRWQKNGREGKTTEVVLDRFNSRLRILTSNRAEQEEKAASSEARPPHEAVAEARQPDFEDELPF